MKFYEDERFKSFAKLLLEGWSADVAGRKSGLCWKEIQAAKLHPDIKDFLLNKKIEKHFVSTVANTKSLQEYRKSFLDGRKNNRSN